MGLSTHRPPRCPVQSSGGASVLEYEEEYSSLGDTNDKDATTRGMLSLSSQYSKFWHRLQLVGILFSDPLMEYSRLHAIDSHLFSSSSCALLSTRVAFPLLLSQKTKQSIILRYHYPLSFLWSDDEKSRSLDYNGNETAKDDHCMIPPEEDAQNGSLATAMLGVVNKAMMGPAILYLPYGFATSGYAFAIPIVLASTAMYLYASHCLLECWHTVAYTNNNDDTFTTSPLLEQSP
jgi:hypothetical protein